MVGLLLGLPRRPGDPWHYVTMGQPLGDRAVGLQAERLFPAAAECGETEQRGAEQRQCAGLGNGYLGSRIVADRQQHLVFGRSARVVLALLVVAGECVLNQSGGTAEAAAGTGVYSRAEIGEIASEILTE